LDDCHRCDCWWGVFVRNRLKRGVAHALDASRELLARAGSMQKDMLIDKDWNSDQIKIKIM